MSGGARAGAGRKAAVIDLLELEKLCMLQASDEEIAGWFGVSVHTIKYRRRQPRFAAVMRRGRSRGQVNIRRAQMKLVDAGDSTMTVWLGKCHLGQRDIPSIRVAIPRIRNAQDLGKAAEKVTRAVARGMITPTEGGKVMSLIESHARIIVAVDLASRVDKIEEKQAAAPVSGPSITGLPIQ